MRNESLPALETTDVPDEEAPFIRASKLGDVPTLQSLAGANPALVHQPDDQGHRPLQWAALHNHIPVITFLLG